MESTERNNSEEVVVKLVDSVIGFLERSKLLQRKRDNMRLVPYRDPEKGFFLQGLAVILTMAVVNVALWATIIWVALTLLKNFEVI